MPMSERTPEAILITGVYGSGKSTVAAEIAAILEARDEPFALLDLDYLTWANPPAIDVHDDLTLLLRNVASVSRTYLDADIDRFVLAGYVERADDVTALRTSIAMPLAVIGLDVPWAELERRFTAEVASSRLDDLREAARQFASTPALDGARVMNVRPPDETAAEILRLVGW
jgi:adenylate kinase family enzyme